MDAACLPAELRDGVFSVGWEVLPDELRAELERHAALTADEAAHARASLAAMAAALRTGRSPSAR